MSLLASAPYPLQAILRTRATGTVKLCHDGLVLASSCFLQRRPRSSMSLAAPRSGPWLLTEPALSSQRRFSQIPYLARRWMERGQQPTHRSQIQQASPRPRQHLQNQHPHIQQNESWTAPPQTTYQTALLATYGLIGLFCAVFCAHNYAERGSILPNGAPLPTPPGWTRISEVLGFEKGPSRTPSSSPSRRTSHLLSQHLPTTNPWTSFTQWVKTHSTSPQLSYRTSDYPPPLTPTKLTPFAASLITHFEPIHLLLASLATYAITPKLILSIGAPRTIAVFALGGSLAITLQCAVDRAYALNFYPGFFKWVKAAPHGRDPHPQGTLGAQHVGSSAALFAMGTVRALAGKGSGQRAWRVLAACAVAVDAVGFYMDVDSAVSYTAHLAGVASGLVLWVGWLRWTGVGRAVRLVGR